MDRESLTRLGVIALLAVVFFVFLWPKLSGSGGPQTQPITRSIAGERPRDPAATTCQIQGNRFKATLTTEGAAMVEYVAEGAKYTVDGNAGSRPMNLVSTPDHEVWRPLHFEWRAPGAESQVTEPFHTWRVESSTEKECVFAFSDAKVELRKVIKALDRPFEIEVTTTITNKGTEKATHRASVSTTAWHYEKEIEGGFGRQSPFVTQVECGHDGKVAEKTPADFEPDDFKGAEFKDGWLRPQANKIDFAATSNFYFAQALIPLEGAGPPSCELQIEELWDSTRFKNKSEAKDADPARTGSAYKSRLIWNAKDLAPGEQATYKVLHFMGPKERDVLASAGGANSGLSNLIHLGTFAFIAKLLIFYLNWCFSFTKSWGVAIILLTITVRAALFYLTWKQIQSGLSMRLLKPEMDAINAKYGEDMQQKQLAIMELYKKHSVNPMAGCLPALIQMPVWFALYTAIQTAAELYHAQFLWFKDLSAPDTIFAFGHEIPFILPWLLGITSFVQQKLMPMQMDPAQQKMMTYVLPGVFTVMMLFLPSGLGVYMFTNSILSIIQTIIVERYYAKKMDGGGGGGIQVREKGDGSGSKGSGEKLALSR